MLFISLLFIGFIFFVNHVLKYTKIESLVCFYVRIITFFHFIVMQYVGVMSGGGKVSYMLLMNISFYLRASRHWPDCRDLWMVAIRRTRAQLLLEFL